MAALARWSRELMQAARTVEHPFSAGLMQEAWAVRARSALAASA
jgi:DNA polymerase-3 subunit delta'